MELLKKFFKDESGQGLVEYALIIALVVIVAIVAVRTLGSNVSTKLDEAATEIGGATP